MTRVGLPRPVLRLQVLLCLAPPRLASSCRVLSCCVLSLFCGVWPCPVLPCLASLCLVFFLPCLVLSFFFCFEVQANCDWLVLPRFMLPLFSYKNC